MLLLSLLIGLALTALYAGALYAVAWQLGRRKGLRWLPLAWLTGGLLYCALTLAKFWIGGVPLHVPPRTSLERLALFAGLGYGLCGATLLMLSVRKRLWISARERPTAADLRAGIGAFLCGMLLTLIVPAMQDVAALYHRLAH